MKMLAQKASFRSASFWFVVGLSAAVLSVAVPQSGWALVGFGDLVLAPNAASDAPGPPDMFGNTEPVDDNVSLAGDAAGNWVAVWSSRDSADGLGSDEDVVSSVSADGGATWSPLLAVTPDAATDGQDDHDSGSAVATDGAGVWLVVLTPATAPDLVLRRSVDNGASWGVPITVPGGYNAPQIAEAAGTWLVVAWGNPPGAGTDGEIEFSRSVDAGLTWSAAGTVNVDAMSDSERDTFPRVVGDGAGNWLVAWNGDGNVDVAVSVDDGQSWGPRTALGGSSIGLTRPVVATDGAGRWIVTWENNQTEAVYSISDDLGTTWTAPQLLDSGPRSADRNEALPWIETDGSGTWYVAWFIINDSMGGPLGTDPDIVISRSLDNGDTWSSPAALDPSAKGQKGGELSPVLAYGGAGRWLAAYSTDHPFGGSLPKAGDDADIVFLRATDDCPTTPFVGCVASTEPGGGRIDLRDKDGLKDSLKWKLRYGEETTVGDIGDPVAGDDYLFCMYDSVSATPELILEMDLPGGSLCKGKACWKVKGDVATYKDGRSEHGPIRAMKLTGGEAGRTQIKMKVGTVIFGVPQMPLQQDSEVTLQLSNTVNGTCWESVFSTSDENTASRFRADSD
jgi:hypothetical protein